MWLHVLPKCLQNLFFLKTCLTPHPFINLIKNRHIFSGGQPQPYHLHTLINKKNLDLHPEERGEMGQPD